MASTRGRPAQVDKPVVKQISLPTSVVGKVELELYCPIEQRVPYGAWGNLVAELLRDWLAKRGT